MLQNPPETESVQIRNLAPPQPANRGRSARTVIGSYRPTAHTMDRCADESKDGRSITIQFVPSSSTLVHTYTRTHTHTQNRWHFVVGTSYGTSSLFMGSEPASFSIQDGNNLGSLVAGGRCGASVPAVDLGRVSPCCRCGRRLPETGIRVLDVHSE